MGELHLDIIVDRLKREFNVSVNVGSPQVAYKECITKKVEQECKFAKQSGGRGQYGHVIIEIEPNEAGKGIEFINALSRVEEFKVKAVENNNNLLKYSINWVLMQKNISSVIIGIKNPEQIEENCSAILTNKL